MHAQRSSTAVCHRTGRWKCKIRGIPLPLEYNAPFVLTFTFACIVVFFADVLSGGMLHTNYFCINGYFSLSRPWTWFMLVSHTIGHVNSGHLIGNLSSILLLGPLLEDKYGSVPLLFMSLVTSCVTALLSVCLLRTGLLGASGIVFLFILLSSFTTAAGSLRPGMDRGDGGRGSIPLTAILVSALYLGHEVWRAFYNDEISQFAHIMGGACGAVFGFLGVRRTSSFLNRAASKLQPQQQQQPPRAHR